ncbi:hypothetical protein HBI56_170940 [Parastagonospora nodorum]|uniref:Myb-like DNA-binding domain-containing protein n=2 Tax=Phaeosphaeria nodorum (strain SN15 / ATCC MYA-4574 / FGSC 10173) TaxID=321614 RepID=A0A7U2F1K3_PHANO|nr:hypothetical protein SNOG_14073 [Parastagonospora nodorum SN15]KAH3904438.1 hypothetical protein HBH56_233760 [Parastagonospora nodorum]EAT78698.1 hypothetical protein SNOG_14073 [Parastagonospora nodorum SN15]KAH3921329.1 hypothetical protein HBH54_241820 [Parastagonospora nodorum]KAH3944465.1 hypothetical protein HBH53_158430 [Parastagonospora nodorum]KAH3959411.1 hypothetical protein HBH52_245230 [Parastagonospora nodorum]
MPTEQENVQYLYLVLTNGSHIPQIDWDAVAEALDLKKGAVSKRWSRLKNSMDAGEAPGPSVYKFLWLCIKHSTRDKVLNWSEIAQQCGTTVGAASKRYSRMKQAFDAGDAPPGSAQGTPAPKTSARATPKKCKVPNTTSDLTPTPKRKRATPKKKAVEEDDEEHTDIESQLEHDEDEEMQTPKRAKVTSKMRTKKEASMSVSNSEAKTFIKGDVEDAFKDDVEDESKDAESFVDAQEWVNDLVAGSTIGDDEDHDSRELSPRFI